MKKKLFIVLSALVVMLFALGVTSCNSNDDDPNDGTSSTWTFENSAASHDYIEVTIKNDGTPSSFTLRYGESQRVTWYDKGSSYRGGYEATAYKSNNYNTDFNSQVYDSLKKVSFYSYSH